jgi:CRP/FNR family cyclic AMP-dependent transcriptional regulator
MRFTAPEFASLNEPARQSLAAAATIRTYGNNEFIYLQEDEAAALHFVRTGHVRLSQILEDGSAILFAILPPGEAFGELGVFESGLHCDMATAIGKATVASVPVRSYRRLFESHPELEGALGRLVARRYRSYIDLTRNLSLRSLSARLAQSILRLADGLGTFVMHAGRRCPCIDSVVNQTDLGLMARGARGNVNRALKSWERAGWIATANRSIIIVDRAKLEFLAFQEND